MINGIAFIPTDAEANSVPSAGTPSTMLAVVGTDFSYSGDTELALTASACVLTYTGLPIDVLVTLAVTFSSAGGGSEANARAGVAINGDLVGLGVGDNALAAAGVQKQYNTQNGQGIQIVSQRRVTLNNGDTIQPVLAQSSAIDLTLEYLTLMVQQLTP